MQDHAEGTAKPGSPLRWLLLALAFTVGTLSLAEAWLAMDDDFWAQSVNPPRAETHSAKALRVEAQLRQGRDEPRADVVLMGNSVIIHNVNPEILAEHFATVRKVAVHGMSFIEIAMVMEDLQALRPRLIILATPPVEVFRPSGWSALRFFDPSIAQAFTHALAPLTTEGSEPPSVRDHLRGLLIHHFGLIRHRHALIERMGASTGLPLQGMLEDIPDGPGGGEHVQVRALPTSQTLALKILAEGLTDLGTQVMVFSPPLKRAGSNVNWTLLNAQKPMESHLHDLSQEAGFTFVPSSELRPIPPELYHDPYHLLPEGRDLLTGRLVPHVQAVLQREPGGHGAL